MIYTFTAWSRPIIINIIHIKLLQAQKRETSTKNLSQIFRRHVSIWSAIPYWSKTMKMRNHIQTTRLSPIWNLTINLTLTFWPQGECKARAYHGLYMYISTDGGVQSFYFYSMDRPRRRQTDTHSHIRNWTLYPRHGCDGVGNFNSRPTFSPYLYNRV